MSPKSEIPQYLQSEEAFTRSAPLNTRYSFVRNNEAALGKDLVQRYSDGKITTDDNEKLMAALKNNPRLRQLFEQASGIRSETRTMTRSVREKVDNQRVIPGYKSSKEVADAFPINVTHVLCSDGRIASRGPGGGYFYYPGATQAFYLGKGETGTAVEFENNPPKRNFFQRVFNRKPSEGPKSTMTEVISAQEIAQRKNATITEAAKNILGDGTYIDYLKLNTEISDAVARDMKGKFLEGGFIGIFQKNNELAKVLNALDPAQRAKVIVELNKVENKLRQEIAQERGIGSFLKNTFGSIIGRRSKDYQAAVYANGGQKIDGYKKRGSAIETAVTAALSLLITGGASVTVLFGKMSLGIPAQQLDGASKDIAAQAVAGQDARSLEYARYKKEQSLKAELGNASVSEIKNSQSTLAGLLGVSEETIRALTPDRIEKGELNRNVNMKNPEMRRAWLNYLAYFYQTKSPHSPVTNRFITMACSKDSAEAFANAYTLPDYNAGNLRDIKQGLSQFYKTGDAGILITMLNHPTRYLGLTSMVKSMMNKGDTDESTSDYYAKYMQKGTVTETRSRETAYGDKIADIQNRESVAQHFEARRDWLVPKYIGNINNFTGKNISAESLIQGIRTYGEYKNANDYAYNTARGQAILAKNPMLKKGAMFVPVEVDGGIQMIGIVPDCSNLAVGPFFSRFDFKENDKIAVPARLALAWSFGLGGGGGGGGSSSSSSSPGSTQGASNGNGALSGGPVSGSAYGSGNNPLWVSLGSSKGF